MLYTSKSIEDVMKLKHYRSSQPVKGTDMSHELVVTRLKTILKDRSGDTGKVVTP